MYYIIQTNEMWGMGGSLSTVKLFKKASEKNLLTNFLKDEFNKAMEDEDVEFINGCEKCCIDIEEIDNELSIQYACDGMDYTRVSYNIVSDLETEFIEEPPEPLLTMPRGLILFCAEYMDEDTEREYIKYVVGKTYNSAFNRWYKDTCSCHYRFEYDFYEIEDEETIDMFVKYHGRENIKAGLYSRYC